MAMECGKKATRDNTRNSRGHFIKGHTPTPGGGRPLGGSEKQKQLRDAMLACVSTKDIEDVMQAMVKEAKAGDTAAAKLVLERCLGAPQVDVNLHGDILAATSAGLAALLAGAGPRRGS